jgi:hypothetical protein
LGCLGRRGGTEAAPLGLEKTYVTDTHARMLFASGKAARMSRKCAQIFGRAGQQQERVHVSIVCFFELAICWSAGG